MATLITQAVVNSTKNTFNTEERSRSLEALRVVAGDSRIQDLAQAFALGQAGKALDSINAFRTLADSVSDLGDKIHLLTKMCCATAPIVTMHQNGKSNYMVHNVAAALKTKMTNLDELDGWRQKTYRNLTADALGITINNFADLCDKLQNVTSADLKPEVLPQTFVYAAIASLNFMRYPEQHSTDSQFAAFENVLNHFGNDFARGHLIFVRHLMIAGQYDRAQNWLDQKVAKFTSDYPSLVSITASYMNTIQQLRDTTNTTEKQEKLAPFLDSSKDSLGHPASTLSDSDFILSLQNITKTSAANR